MKLSDLAPKWLMRNGDRRVLMFLCPHCKKTKLTCKSFVAGFKKQVRILEAAGEFGDDIVTCEDKCAWKMQGEIENLTVTPSLDASKAGHWHGHITRGEIVGGI